MKTIKTDANGVELALGEHLSHDPNEHVSFGRNPFEGASFAYVDSINRRVIYFPTNQLTGSIAGGKVKAAEAAYEAKYGSLGVPCVLHVRNGIVTSFLHATQKHTYHWDWEKNKQIIDRDGNGGWKY